MTREPDIVERLHDLYATHPIVMDAAAEIDRLEAMHDDYVVAANAMYVRYIARSSDCGRPMNSLWNGAAPFRSRFFPSPT